MPNTQTDLNQFSETELETYQFLNGLVQAVLGYSITEIPADKREEFITKCTDLFTNYINAYVERRYGKKDALRLQANQSFAGQDIFNKFSDLGDKFDEAYDSFLDFLAAKESDKPTLIA